MNGFAEWAKNSIKSAADFVGAFVKWLLFAAIIGAATGAVGTIFHISISWATELRTANDWIIYLLPVGGAAIVLLYQVTKLTENAGTNQVIGAIRTDGKVPVLMAPVIFISTVITHLLGGSAGREGAALQLGGSLGSQIGGLLRLDEKDMHLAVLCGMSGVFSSLFGTPLTAAIFVMEVVSVGIIYYSAVIPCIISSITAYLISVLAGVKPEGYILSEIPQLDVPNLLRTIALGAGCAAVSILFCLSLSKGRALFSRLIPNNYLRIIAGGAVIVLLTLLLGTHDYNGAGNNIIELAIMEGTAKPEAFLLKIIFTAITIGTGYRGGEIVPTFFIGATFGCFFGSLLGLPPTFAAALGLAAMFCGATNTPIASVALSVELFGSEGLPMFAAVCAVSYMLSGYYSLYSTQKIMYSKLKAIYINKDAKM